MLLWNVLLNKPAPAKSAVAVSKHGNKGHAYFLVPWKGKLFAGTGQKPWLASVNVEGGPMPSKGQLDEFLGDINGAVPGLNADLDDILYITAGLLPAKRAGSDRLAVREVIYDHSKDGGPKGLWSISGVKFTTSRLVAEKTIRKVFPGKQIEADMGRQELAGGIQAGIFDFNWEPSKANGAWQKDMRKIIETEAVVHLDDLVLRRTTLWDNPERALNIATDLGNLFAWDEARRDLEIQTLKAKFNRKRQPLKEEL
jgi:glycerol-3-phosphate dehydrogenase